MCVSDENVREAVRAIKQAAMLDLVVSLLVLVGVGAYIVLYITTHDRLIAAAVAVPPVVAGLVLAFASIRYMAEGFDILLLVDPGFEDAVRGVEHRLLIAIGFIIVGVFLFLIGYIGGGLFMLGFAALASDRMLLFGIKYLADYDPTGSAKTGFYYMLYSAPLIPFLVGLILYLYGYALFMEGLEYASSRLIRVARHREQCLSAGVSVF